MNLIGHRSIALPCGLLLVLSACASLPGEGLGVTTQRPSISSDTNTTALGSVEVEVGAIVDPGDAASLPVSVKFGAGPRTEVFANLTALNRIELPGSDESGLGDLALGFRHRFWEGDDGTSTAVQLATKLPTADADEGLGSGELDVFVAGIVSQQFDERTSGTAYLELGVLGDPVAPGTDSQTTLALALGYQLQDDLAVFTELAQLWLPADEDQLLGMLGLAYTWSTDVAFDLAVAGGLDDDSPDLQLVAGMTVNLGRPGR